jgi:formylglycine-generating enzyme required for sulfatase activity
LEALTTMNDVVSRSSNMDRNGDAPKSRPRPLPLVLIVAAALAAAAPRVAVAQLADSDFVLVHPGTFQMGSPAGNADEQPVHPVTLTHGFWMQKTLVTQAQWQAVMGTNPSHHKDCPTCPVDSVSYEDAQRFITKLNARSGKTYRLPTEAEWEYAARAGTTTDYYVPLADLLHAAWIVFNSKGTTHPVGTLRPNAWGLYDMEGNVWEWVRDWYGPYPSGPVTNPRGAASGKEHIARGGSYAGNANYVRSAYRLSGGIPSFKSGVIGFRLARSG